jgi:predicted ATP-grasp superfamily ATP-dependent carboligase
MIAPGGNLLRPGPRKASIVLPSLTQRPRLLIAGGSVRSFAVSAARAGFEVHAADLFADLDLRTVAATVRLPRPYPDGLPAAVASQPAGAWVYTGAVENHPAVIAAIMRDRPLAGCRPEAVESVREPDRLAALVARAGFVFPETRSDPAGLPTDGSWLVKPRRSAGGHGIVPWHGSAAAAAARSAQGSDAIWQRRIVGPSCSAAYLAAADGGRLIGVSRQLVGRRWCHARPFHYCGSVDLDPGSLPAALVEQLGRLRRLLADACGLVGLVGVDLVIDPQGRGHVIEVNPRPTASMELIERASGLSLARGHVAACGLAAPAKLPGWPRAGTWSKAILFARRRLVIDETAVKTLEAAAGPPHAGWPSLADIPAPPQVVPAGHPICTLFAHAASPRESLARLRHRTTGVARALRLSVAEPAASTS